MKPFRFVTAPATTTSITSRIFACARNASLLALGLLTWFAIPSSASAQNIQFTQGSVGSSLGNTLQVPLREYPGRGMSLPVTLYYSSQVWRIKFTRTIYNPYDRSQSQPLTEAVFSEHSAAGWTTSLGIPELEWPESNQVYDYKGKSVCLDCRSTPFSPDNYWKVPRLTVHMPDGSSLDLRRDDTPYTGPVNNAGTYYAVDGSRVRYDTSTATLYLPDGMRYVMGESTVQVIDPNGNTMSYDKGTGQWTDSVGRVISAPPLSNYPGVYDYSLPGVGGGSVNYKFHFTYLANALEPDPETGTVPQLGYSGGHYINGNPSINNLPQPLPAPHLFETTENSSSGMYDYVIAPQSIFNPVVLTQIELPNGLSYIFRYNQYGELARVVYPTGGFEQYKYGQVPSVASMDAPYDQANRGVTSRWLSPTGTGADRARWQYGASFDSVAKEYKQWIINPAPDNTYIERYLFKAPPISNYTNLNYPKFGFEDPRNGRVYDERVYQYQSGPMLRRTLSDSTYSSRNVSVVFNGQTTTAPAMRNPRETKSVSLILDTGDGYALAKTLTYGYDVPSAYEFSTGLNLTTSSESGFDNVPQATGQTGTIGAISPGGGSVLSTTVTTYLDDASYRNRHILGLPTSVVLKDANGQPVARSETVYDQPGYSVSIAGQAVGWSDPATPARGNATTSRSYVSLNPDIYLENHISYDQWGNVRSTWDVRGNQSQVSYLDSFGDGINRNTFAYATSTTSAVPDPTGTYGSNVPLTSANTYDYTTGLVLSTTDANGQTTTFDYRDDQNVADPLNRLRKVTQPDGSWTKNEFNDVAGNLYTMSETQFDSSRTTKDYQFFDALGRASRSFALESGMTYLVSDTEYDAMGRVRRTTNPYRVQGLGGTINAAELRWTVSQYDALGRLRIMTLPDNTTVQNTYQGVYTTVTDQAGKQRRQKTDALGRVVRVDEPDASGNLGTTDEPRQASYYDYNTQGNLIHIQQGAAGQLQHRYFKYDGLSRLTYERQVEQSAIFTSADTLTGNSQWTRKILYDENNYQGLPTRMADARNVVKQFQYDNLDRISQVSYSDDTSTVKNYYDVVRFTVTGEQRTIHNLGRLVEVTTETGGSAPATSQAYNYDAMGRVASSRQTVGANAHTMSYGYNLGGALVSEKYPSGRVVSNAFDDAARPSSVSSGSKVYASQFDYSLPQGLLKAVNLGNGAVQTFDYNDRLQLKTLGLTKGGSVLQKYEYKYGRVNADGTVDETKNNGQIGRIEGFIGAAKQWQQRLSYDSLGRLSQASEHRGDNGQQSYLINYNYDAFGNRYQYQSSNQNALAYIPVEDSHVDRSNNRFSSGVAYDAAGNITVDNKFRNRHYQYDANGRQKSTALPDGTSVAVSVYDGAGQRVATISNGVTIILVYDAMGKLLAEYGTPPPTSGGTQFIFSDHQGSPRVVMNQSGDVVARHDYQPFGEEIYSGIGQRTTAQRYDQGHNARQKYAGMEMDESSGLSHTLWRKYDGMSGRWSSPDPYGGSLTIVDPQSFNRYSYVTNDPVNLTDSLGLMADADRGYGGFEGWGGTSGLNDPHFGGPPILRNAIGRHDYAVSNDRYGGNYSDPTPFDDNAGARSANAWVQNPETGEMVPAGGTIYVSDNDSTHNGSVGDLGLNMGGAATSGGEYLNVAGELWKGPNNGKWYRGLSGRGPNQYTGARSVALARAQAFRYAARGLFGISVVYNFYEMGTGEKPVWKGALDIGAAYVGTFCGVPGFILATAYFVVDFTLLSPAGPGMRMGSRNITALGGASCVAGPQDSNWSNPNQKYFPSNRR